MNDFPFLPTSLVFLALVALPPALAVDRVKVDHAHVSGLAKSLSEKPYAPSDHQAPEFFRKINYDTYRRITFRPEKTLWRDTDLRFQLQFFHPGYLFTRMVRLNEFTDTHSQPIAFAQDLFDYHDLNVPLLSRMGLNFAGFRILHPVNRPEVWDEVMSFLGASYFRGLARHQAYGASARGLALNAGGPGTEEFPEFVEFWIGKPAPAVNAITVHALLDSPSVAGAYTFLITPGEETVVETRATLYFRQTVDVPGFIPVSSMFWFGEDSPTRFGDFRPEVHDSDGLLVAPDADTRLWRPLRNPATLEHTDFEAPAFAGFGLLQRDREHRSYADIEAHYERRASVWTEPVGAWPPGRVRLVEIPTKGEYQDNITAFWTPTEKIPPGQPFELAWRQRWTSTSSFGGPPGWVSATRQTIHEGGAPDRTKYVIDFDAKSLAHLPAEATLTAEVTATDSATVQHSQVFRNMATGARRLVLVLSAPAGSPAVEIRARLLFEQQPVTETWTTRWQP
jgi:glucans biosynthesis protein